MIVSVSNANIYQGNNLILQDVNFTIKEGEFVFLVGKTGTGKSSLLKTLYGELPLREGEATVADFQIKGMTWKQVPFLRRNLGIIFQDFHLLTDRNIHENLSFVLKSTGWTDKQLINQRIEEMLAKVGLDNKSFKMPHEMSGGEQQRVGIARALLNSPKLILADEPTGNLDPDTSNGIMQLLLSINKEFNTTILMATHDYEVIRRYPSRILKTENGEVLDSNVIYGK